MMETVRTSEKSVYLNDTTQHYIPEGRRENLKSHIVTVCLKTQQR
jgi:hypothetical protein